jgi:hypothetical protein
VAAPTPDDPLGIDDEMVDVRLRWDEQIAADLARWDKIVADALGGTPSPAPVDVAAPAELNDPPEWFTAAQKLTARVLGEEPPAVTAGEQDHSNPWVFAGDDAPPPVDTGRPPAGPA